MAKLNLRILQVLIIGGGFDAFGDNGNTFARNVIFSNRYDIGKLPIINTAMLVIKVVGHGLSARTPHCIAARFSHCRVCIVCVVQVVGVFSAMVLVLITTSKGKVSMAAWCLVGNLASAVAQFAVVPNDLPSWAFIVIWGLAQCFGFTSTMASSFLLPRYAPPEARGYWSGLNFSVTQMAMALAPVTLSLIYSSASPPNGSPASEYAGAEMACLVTTGCISLVAFLLYTPLPALVPKPTKDALTSSASFTQLELDGYLAMTVKEFTRLDAETRVRVNRQLLNDGKQPLDAHWTTYHEDLADGELDRIRTNARGTIKFLKAKTIHALTDPAELLAFTKLSMQERQASRARYDIDAERAIMGKWIADYLDDAGYHSWYTSTGVSHSSVCTLLTACVCIVCGTGTSGPTCTRR